ncbi:MAG: dihydrofolate reductase [Bacteroidales bacterium]
MKNISIIAAIADNGAIGKNNDLIWRLPNDLKRFKSLTNGHTIVMGRRTFESLPKGALPNRKNVVMTSMPEAIGTSAFVCSSWEEMMDLTEKDQDVFIIGGASIYRDALSIANRMYITRVHETFDADVFFPEIDYSEWEEVSRTECKADEKHLYDYTFIDYIRKEK